MLIGRDRGPNHGSVTVELDERCFLVDASMLHDTPLELHAEKHREIRHGGWGLRSRPDGEDWLIWWRPLHLPQGCFCRIEGREVERREWLAHNDLTRTVSPFNASLYVRKNIGDEVVGVEHGARTVFYSDGRVARERLRHSRILECLSAELGYAPELLARLPCDDFDS